jgi:hypothetical protein
MSRLLSVVDSVVDCTGAKNTKKRLYATEWWLKRLRTMDYMPKCAPRHLGLVFGLGLGFGSLGFGIYYS